MVYIEQWTPLYVIFPCNIVEKSYNNIVNYLNKSI